jgi:DNA primase
VKAAGLTARVARLPEGSDPDELVRSGGRVALDGVLARATGLVEFLLEAALDATFSSANAGERSTRIDEVVRLLREEDDPLRRAMWKAYVDQLAARLDIRDVATFHALEARVRRDLAVEVQARGPRPEEARVRAPDPGSHERRAILDALIEWPVLVFDPEIDDLLSLMQGPLVPIVHALRESWNHERNQMDTAQFLKSVPESHRGHCARVLSTSRFFDAEEAKGCLLKNANKLKRLLLSQETHELAKENYVETGDPETETERATEALQRSRRKHGLKE